MHILSLGILTARSALPPMSRVCLCSRAALHSTALNRKEVMASHITVSYYDWHLTCAPFFVCVCVCVFSPCTAFHRAAPQGGDGFFNEVLNGLVRSRHAAPPCPRPRLSRQQDGMAGTTREAIQRQQDEQSDVPPAAAVAAAAGASAAAGAAGVGTDGLVSGCGAVKSSGDGGREKVDASTKQESAKGREAEKDMGLKLRRRLRIGIIPAGSTDTIIIRWAHGTAGTACTVWLSKTRQQCVVV